jgi:hypothetical protein
VFYGAEESRKRESAGNENEKSEGGRRKVCKVKKRHTTTIPSAKKCRREK